MQIPGVSSGEKFYLYALTTAVDYVVISALRNPAVGYANPLCGHAEVLLWAVPATILCLTVLTLDVTDWLKKQRLLAAC